MWSQSLVFTFLFAILSLSSAQNTDINTGSSYYALRFPDAGQASVTLPEALSGDLPLSFSFEAWVMLPAQVGSTQVTAADGLYKTIVSRYAVRPDGTYHNRYADFNLQVQRNGDINFFMGNGLSPSFYGIIITPGALTAGKWTHLAFSVHTSEGSYNPDYVTVFLDGVPFNGTWKSGDRQLREDVPIHLGAYLNQDDDVKWWRGYMDEIRFWSGYRSTEEIQATMHVAVDSKEKNLLAYYKCDYGSVLVDATHRYDGQFVSGAGVITYELSGVKLGLEFSVARQGRLEIELTGVGSSSFVYVLETVPNPTTGRLLVNGIAIFSDNLPYSLPGNKVTFEAANVEDQIASFKYFGSNDKGREPMSTPVSLFVDKQACKLDACGVCNGDNSTCSCLDVPYMGYDAPELEKILLLFELESSMNMLDEIEIQLDQALDAAASSEDELGGAIDKVQEFSEVCLHDLQTYLTHLLDDLSE